MVKVKGRRLGKVLIAVSFNHPMVKVKDERRANNNVGLTSFNHPMVKVKVPYAVYFALNILVSTTLW